MTQEPLERIRLLSLRFQELQGLRVAAAGAIMALVVGAYLMTTPVPSNDGAMIALLAWFALTVPSVWSLNRYYATRFGRQVSGPRRSSWKIHLIWFVYFVVASILNARIEAIPAGAPTVAAVAVASVWMAIRDWPWRAYYLFAPAAVGIGFAASAPVTGVLGPGMTLGVIFLLLGASMVPIGVLDHLQLVRLVKEVRARLPAVAIVLAGCVAGSIALEAGPPSANLNFKLPKSTTLGEPAIMTARLDNTTGYRIVVDFGVNDQTEFVFRQIKPDGSAVRVTPALAPASRMRTSHLMLRDTSYTASIVLDQWLDLSQIGPHTIEVEFRGSVQIDGGDPAGLKRAVRLVIDVKPRDPARLEKRGAEWLKQVSTLSPGSDARTAASALVAMKDPVAIPYLELATTRTRSAQFVDAMKTMNHPDARAALDRLARSKDPDVRALAQKALTGR